MNKRSMVGGRRSMATGRSKGLGTGRRFARFNVVGAIGVGVQLGVLTLLLHLGLNYLAATFIAVETAILHNFAWHERYTWRDRAGVSAWERFMRLLRFHLANGLVSLAGNALLMRWLVGELHLPVLLANMLAIAACGIANFVLGDRMVFTSGGASAAGLSEP